MTFTANVGPLLISLGSAALVTVSSEVVVAGLLGFRTTRDLGIVALANLATNPVANLLLAGVMALVRTGTLAHPLVLATLVVLELAAVVAEWRIYHLALPHHRPRALRVAAIANAASLMIGLIVFGLGTPMPV